MKASFTVVDGAGARLHSDKDLMGVVDSLRDKLVDSITITIDVADDINFWQLKKAVGILKQRVRPPRKIGQ